jgi:hypothetical protein
MGEWNPCSLTVRRTFHFYKPQILVLDLVWGKNIFVRSKMNLKLRVQAKFALLSTKHVTVKIKGRRGAMSFLILALYGREWQLTRSRIPRA